jgi:cellulose synthase/poly-beta-1,6-N-acetylglucosamine synthase-like glycosyltransferase
MSDTVTTIALLMLAIPVVLLIYAYLIYPLGLWCVAGIAGRGARRLPSAELPMITVTLPVYNEERILRSTLEHVLSLEFNS